MDGRREDLGSWLEGTPGEPLAGRTSGGGVPGVPAQGPGSLAPVPRRLLALLVDWVLSSAVSAGFAPQADAPGIWLTSGEPMVTLAIFAVSTIVLVSTLGTSVGHRLLRMRVVRLRDLAPPAPRPTGRAGRGAMAVPVAPGAVPAPGLTPAIARTVLLCLVLPAVVWDRSGRGLHDVAAGTALVRT